MRNVGKRHTEGLTSSRVQSDCFRGSLQMRPCRLCAANPDLVGKKRSIRIKRDAHVRCLSVSGKCYAIALVKVGRDNANSAGLGIQTVNLVGHQRFRTEVI
jgi:hypothetical protein